MGTLTSTIGLSSPDSLPFALNSTTAHTSTVGNFSEVGVLKLTDNNYGINHSAFLSPKAIGPNGAWVFVQNPSTNAYKIKLYGVQQIEEEYNEMTFEGMQSFATLKPGDSTLVPLTPQQYDILAVSTFGDSTLNYYIVDRGGEFGKSILILDDTNTNWQYIMADAELGETLPVINANNASRDLGFAVASWTHTNTWVVNNKGYVLKFNNGGGDYKYMFINSRGENTTLDTTIDYEVYNDNLGLIFLDDSSGVNVYTLYFDGDNYYTHTIPGAAGNVLQDWDYKTTDGSFIINVSDYDSNSGDTATILVNKDKTYILQVINYGSTLKFVDDAAVYVYGNFIFLTIYDDDIQRYNKIQIWNTSGKLLYNIDVTDYNFNNMNYKMYGTNKLQIILRDNDNINNNDFLLNYNGTTNKLIGFDAYEYSLDPANGLTWIHSRGTDYANRLVYAYEKWPTDSIRPWNYTWNSGLYDAESIAIVYVNNYNQNSGLHVNSTVDFCDIVYVLDGQTDHSTYVFADDQTKYIRIPSEYEGSSFRITPSSNLIAFTYGDIPDEGPLYALLITKTGVGSTTLIGELLDVSNASNSIYVKPVGDYIMYNWYNTVTDSTTYAMVKGGVKDTVNIPFDYRSESNFKNRVNSLWVRSYDPTYRNWYFNTTTNKFTQLTTYYPQTYYNKSTTTNGLNDGNILLGPEEGNDIGGVYPYGLNNSMCLLKKGVPTANVTLPSTNGFWELYLGSEAVFYIYADVNDGGVLKVRVYDLNLTLKQTINLGTTSFTNLETIGKRFFIQDNSGSPIVFHMISLNDAVKFTKNDFNEYHINDKYWVDFVA